MKFPPHQRMRMRAMWRKKFYLDDSGISTGKDATAAVIAVLQCILFPDWIATFLAKRIGQLTNLNTEYFLKWLSEEPYFANEVDKIYTPHGIITVLFKNKSMIKMMAAGWDRDAEGVRSERWNSCFLNEWHTYGNLSAIQKTIFGRVTRGHPGKMVDELKECCGNHITLMASAGYKWQPEYRLVENFQGKIDEGNQLYGRQRWDYYDIPKKMREIFTDDDIMTHMHEQLPMEDARVEIFGVWEHSSSDFYNSFEIASCRNIKTKVEVKRMSKTDFYVAGVDVAKSRDDFSIKVIRFSEKTKPRFVYSFRGNRMKNWQMSGMIHAVHKLFRLNFILMDAGGGGLYVKEELERPTQIINGKKVKVGPILTNRDFPVPGGQPILELFKWSKEYQRLYNFFRIKYPDVKGDDGILDTAHTLLKTSIDNEHIDFPIEAWEQVDEDLISEIVKHGYSSPALSSELRIISENIDNTLSELLGVKRKTDKDGTFHLTSKGFYTWISVKKKDSAYGLLYANLAKEIFTHEYMTEDEEDAACLMEDVFSEGSHLTGDEDSILYGDYE